MGRRIAVAAGVGIAAIAVAVAAGGRAEPASLRFSAPVSGPQRGPLVGVMFDSRGGRARLARLDAETLRVRGATLALREPPGPSARSRDGALLAVGSNAAPDIRVVALGSWRSAPRWRLASQRVPVQALAWTGSRRLLALLAGYGARRNNSRRASGRRQAPRRARDEQSRSPEDSAVDAAACSARAIRCGVARRRAAINAAKRSPRPDIWLRTGARQLTATIDGRTFTLRPPAFRGGYWEGFLQPAGLLRPGSALHVTPDRGRYYWHGRHPVRAVLHLSATEADGAQSSTDVAVDLAAGYG